MRRDVEFNHLRNLKRPRLFRSASPCVSRFSSLSVSPLIPPSAIASFSLRLLSNQTTFSIFPRLRNFKEGFLMERTEEKKPRLLCLHGFRTSANVMKIQIGKWPENVLGKLDLVFADAPFPAEGKSDVEGIFPPPFYEWFQFNKEFSEYRNFDKCLEYVEDLMIKQGPFDGFIGFSQGAILSAALPGLQAKGLALNKVPKIKYLIVIGGAKFNSTELAEKAYTPRLELPSLHFLGEHDFLKPHGSQLLESFAEAVVIHHPKGHTVPRLDEKGEETMLNFIKRIQKFI